MEPRTPDTQKGVKGRGSWEEETELLCERLASQGFGSGGLFLVPVRGTYGQVFFQSVSGGAVPSWRYGHSARCASFPAGGG